VLYALPDTNKMTSQKIYLRKCGDFVRIVLCNGRTILLYVICGLILSACVNPAPRMINESTAVISGRATVGDNTSNAMRKTLIKAALMTLDHGFRCIHPVKATVNVM
jgi:hypothetical protein